MRRIPAYATTCGTKKCGACSKRRKVYLPSDEAELKAWRITKPRCSACFQTKRSDYIKKAANRVLAKHRAPRHAFEGSRVVSRSGVVALVPPKRPPPGRVGVCCFVWINGNCFSSEGCLDLAGSIYKDLYAVPGIRSVNINLD